MAQRNPLTQQSEISAQQPQWQPGRPTRAQSQASLATAETTATYMSPEDYEIYSDEEEWIAPPGIEEETMGELRKQSFQLDRVSALEAWHVLQSRSCAQGAGSTKRASPQLASPGRRPDGRTL